MFIPEADEWANAIFGNAQLGDKRRTQRLVKLASNMAQQAGSSLTKVNVDPASIEGAYRFIRNDAISPEDIAQAGYRYTDELVKTSPLVLAIQDTTGLSYRHSVCSELGNVTSAREGAKSTKGRTLYAHSTLMLDASSEQVLGLGEQYYWYRQDKLTGKNHKRQTRHRNEKESFKWQLNSERLATRLGCVDNVIDVCDREADIYEYLDYHTQAGNRFVVRANDERKLAQPEEYLSEHIASLAPCGQYHINIQQKGGRKARSATLNLHFSRITLKRPQRATCQDKTMPLNMVVCQEVNDKGTQDKLCWILYTSELIENAQQARQIVRYYELRWRIEEFHKLWKTDGTHVESLRMQSRENLKRVAVIQAFIAVRLFQLKDLVQHSEEAKKTPCTSHFSEISWKLLWRKTHKQIPLPNSPPSLNWAYYAMAKLGGWYDGTRTGRVGPKALWEGWMKLTELVDDYALFKELDL